jgi:hypothetical protein
MCPTNDQKIVMLQPLVPIHLIMFDKNQEVAAISRNGSDMKNNNFSAILTDGSIKIFVSRFVNFQPGKSCHAKPGLKEIKIS